MPPCTSFDDLEDVPDAMPARSINAVRNPRLTASSATPAPVMPPPTTSTSNCSSARRRSEVARSNCTPSLPPPAIYRRPSDDLAGAPVVAHHGQARGGPFLHAAFHVGGVEAPVDQALRRA